jgi:ankyrin repeat protein
LFFFFFSSSTDAQPLINNQDVDGSTSVFIVSRNGHSAVTKQFIEDRCNVNFQTRDGCTSLHECMVLWWSSVSDTLRPYSWLEDARPGRTRKKPKDL